MKSRAKLLGTAVALLLAQQLTNLITPEWARPDLVLAFALALGLQARASEALVLAFVAGYAVDALSAAPLGLHALLRGTACFATRFAERALYLRAPLPWAIYAGAYVVVDALLVVGILEAFTAQGAPGLGGVALHAPGAAVATALAAAPLYVWMERAAETGDEGSWPSLARPGRL